MRKKLLSSAWIVLFMPTVATASLIWDFTFSGDDLSGSGHIEFSTNSSTTGFVSAFSATGQTFGHQWTSDLSDIDTAGWRIDPATWEIRLLDIDIELIDTVTPDVAVDLHLDFIDSGIPARRSFRAESSTCTGSGRDSSCGAGNVEIARATALFIPTHTTVPEPATFLLLAAGMAGLGFTRRKTKNQWG